MKRKRGRPRKGEERPPKDKTRLERQAASDMTLEQMLDPKFSSWSKTELWQVVDVEPMPVFGKFYNG